MFTAEQYRAGAVEYSRLVKIANSPAEVREFKRLEHTFTELADNANGRLTITTRPCMPRAVPLGHANRRTEALRHRRKQQLVASVLGACRLQAAPR